MLIGHYGIGIALRAGLKRPRLPVWFAAAIFCDLACYVLCLLGLERFAYQPGFTVHFPYRLLHAPFSHSLLGSLALSLIVAGAIRLSGRAWNVALALGAVVFSHFPLDWVVHGPDLAWAGEAPALGLGLWNTPWIAEAVEIVILAAATLWLLRRDPAVSRKRVLGLVAFLLVMSQFRSILPQMPTEPVAANLLGLAAAGLVLSIAWICDRES
jgi:hypothetical protein